MNTTHPYTRFEKTPEWKAIERGIEDLVDNGDMEELTARPHIVGYLTKLLVEQRDTSRETIQTRRQRNGRMVKATLPR